MIDPTKIVTGDIIPDHGQRAPPEADTRLQLASQWQLMWWRFRKHKLALVSGILVILVYLVAAFVEFLAPSHRPHDLEPGVRTAPTPAVVGKDRGRAGVRPVRVRLHVHRRHVSLERTFEIDREQKIAVRFFAKGRPYRMWGFIPGKRHLIGPVDPEAPFYLLGADRLGRDLFSRIIYGTRISMTIGLVGVTMSLVLGILLGGISGYYGGTVDLIIQRIMEILRSMPTIPLWMGMAAAIPPYWSPVLVYFMITIILSVIGWTWLAQAVRGKFYSLKTEDFVIAAKLDGCSELQVIVSHMAPSFMSHIIATLTLAIPQMIIAETALSFLGIGLRPPVVSWGVLLKEAQNVRVLATSPWLFLPGLAVIITVLALNFLGDGIRDAADPYK